MGRRSDHSRILRIVKLVGSLLAVGCFVLLLVRDAPKSSLLSMSLSCGSSSGFFSLAVPWLTRGTTAEEEFQKGDVGVCLVGDYPHHVMPEEVTCALPKAKFVTSKKRCKVWYSDLSHLNSYQTARAVEANSLRLPVGIMLLQKSKPHAVAANRERELSTRLGNDTFYAAFGEPSTLDIGANCKIKVSREPHVDEDDDTPAIYVMMHPGDDIFVTTAKSYAKKRGYGFLVPSVACNDAFQTMPKAWRKIALLRLAIKTIGTNQKHQQKDSWILWLDPAALVTNDAVHVENIVEGPAGVGALLMVGQDAQPPYLLNVGVLLARISDNSAALLESVWRCGVMHGWTAPDAFYWDQNALTHLAERGMVYSEFSFWLPAIRLLPQRVLFSFLRQDQSSIERDLVIGHWRPGDFVALMTGVDSKEQPKQAAVVLQTKVGDKLMFSGSEYKYPRKKIVPPMYSIRIDSYFETEKPTWLHFKTEAPGRHTLNPSCVWWDHGDRYDRVWCVVRTINYNLNLETGFYEWPDVGKTINQFFELSAEQYLHSPGKTLTIESTMEMYIPVSILSKMTPMRTEGFEDVKLIRIGDVLYGISTCLQMNKNFNCEIVLLTIKENRVLSALPLRGFKEHECHKNWMPFEHNKELHLIEAVDPLVVIKPDVVQGRANVAYEDRRTLFPGLRLRGTSNGVQFGKGHLFMIHETITRGKEYAHRFLYLEQGGSYERKLSRPFFVIRKTVEFVIGLRMSEDKSKIILGFGFEDVKVGFMQINIHSQESFLAKENFWMEHE